MSASLEKDLIFHILYIYIYIHIYILYSIYTLTYNFFCRISTFKFKMIIGNNIFKLMGKMYFTLRPFLLQNVYILFYLTLAWEKILQPQAFWKSGELSLTVIFFLKNHIRNSLTILVNSFLQSISMFNTHTHTKHFLDIPRVSYAKTMNWKR